MDPRFTSFADWYAARRSALTRGGLWLAGDEPGRPDPAGFEPARLRILICRLSPYDDVLASITHRILLSAAQAVPGAYADLAFFPPAPDAAWMRKEGIPFWLATGSKRAPADFDVVAISLSVQQEALNLPAALQESGLLLDFSARMAADRHPLILLGGHGAASVPFIHGDAAGPGSGGLVDAVCLGDGITWLQELLRRRLAEMKAPRPKPEFLADLARELPGTYVPAFYRHDVRNNQLAAIEPQLSGLPLPVEFRQDPLETWLKDYDGAYVPFSEEEIEETLPLAAGCIYRCRFCQTGWMRSELSAAAQASLAKSALRFKAAMVNADLNLLASDACSISGLEPIMDALCPLFRHVSVKSLSVSSLVHRPEYFRLLRKLAKHEFTFGIEGISARLRAYLGKPATAGDLLRIAGSLADSGLRQLKLFFILTGLEEERDLDELEQLLKNLHAKVPACRIIASFMPLFHAPFTPLQFAPVRGLTNELEQSLASAVRHGGAEFRWSALPGEIALMNRLCHAGRAATAELVRFSIQRGLRYTRSPDPDLIREFAQALPADAAPKNLKSIFPWNDIRASVDSKILWRSYQKACAEWQATPEAPAASPAPLPRPNPAATAPAQPMELERFHFWTRVRPDQARHPDHVVARAFFRGLFAHWKPGVPAYLGTPLLLRPSGTSGLALVSAEFKAGTRTPPKNECAAPISCPESALLFDIHWPAPEPALAVLERLKTGKVKFQTFRLGTARWHIVERAFRARTGIVALREENGQTDLFCQRHPALLANAPAFLAGAVGETRVLLARNEFPCPACKGQAYTVVNSIAPDAPPLCFDCLTRPAKR